MLASVAAFACLLALNNNFGIPGISVGMLATGLLLRFVSLHRKKSTGLAWWIIIPSMVLCGICFTGWLLLGYGPVVLRRLSHFSTCVLLAQPELEQYFGVHCEDVKYY